MTSESMGTVLVMGATGRHGGTGAHLVVRLRDEGCAVRVLTRGRNARTARLEDLGAEVAVGDLQDRRSLVAALDGVDRVYFAYPIAAGVVTAAANYASAAQEAACAPRTVVMSMGPAQPDHPSELGRAQWLAEQVLQWSGLPLAILRVTALFHENLLVLHSHSIRRERAFRNCFGSVAMPWISALDAAELAVVALLHPERIETTVVYPQGSEQYAHHDIADLLSEVVGVPTRFTPVTRDQWYAELLALSAADDSAVVNPAMAQHISSVGQAVVEGGPARPSDATALQTLIGRPPVTMRDFLRAHRVDFEPTGT